MPQESLEQRPLGHRRLGLQLEPVQEEPAEVRQGEHGQATGERGGLGRRLDRALSVFFYFFKKKNDFFSFYQANLTGSRLFK